MLDTRGTRPVGSGGSRGTAGSLLGGLVGRSQELEDFLMFELKTVSNFVSEESERAIAVMEAIAGVGEKIPEYLVEMYWSNIPCGRDLLEGALGLFMQLDLLEVSCTCDCPGDKLFCLLDRALVQPITIGADLAALLTENVAIMRKTMYAED